MGDDSDLPRNWDPFSSMNLVMIIRYAFERVEGEDREQIIKEDEENIFLKGRIINNMI